jgi:hypothetical protein
MDQIRFGSAFITPKNAKKRYVMVRRLISALVGWVASKIGNQFSMPDAKTAAFRYRTRCRTVRLFPPHQKNSSFSQSRLSDRTQRTFRARPKLSCVRRETTLQFFAQRQGWRFRCSSTDHDACGRRIRTVSRLLGRTVSRLVETDTRQLNRSKYLDYSRRDLLLCE